MKNSGVYLNQLMAFASVSGCVVTSVMQTESRRVSWALLGGKGDAELSNGAESRQFHSARFPDAFFLSHASLVTDVIGNHLKLFVLASLFSRFDFVTFLLSIHIVLSVCFSLVDM